jgi:EmrB/QacA subfamily drug resistance transporter
MWQLIGCRALMGASAAFIMPSTLSILVNVFPTEERAKAIAIWAATTGAAGAIGPVASGWLLGHFWYGSIFLINVPIILVALASGWVLVPKSRDPEQGRLDPVGAVLSIVGISSLVYALIEAPDKGWLGASTVIAFAVAIVVLTAFVAWELHVDEPMLDVRFFRKPAFSTGTGGMILVFLAMFGVMFLITQYFQLVLDYTPLSAAVRLLPMAPIMIIVAPLTPRLSARFGANRVVTFGMLLITGGLLMFTAVGLHTPYLYVLVTLVPLVSGMALSMAPMTAAIMSAVPPRRAGAGSAMNDATRELGAALGIALMGSLAASRYTSRLASVTAHLPAGVKHQANVSLADALAAATRLGGVSGHVLSVASQDAFIDGIRVAVTFGAVLAAISAVVVFRKLPREAVHGSSVESPRAAIETTAELGLAGVEPVLE